MSDPAGEQNPFLRYRERLDSYRAAVDRGLSDQQFVDLVGELDAAVVAVDDRGFRVSPVIDGAALVADAAPHLRLSVKVDAGNVSGSHKSRHLLGAALHLLVEQAASRGCPSAWPSPAVAMPPWVPPWWPVRSTVNSMSSCRPGPRRMSSMRSPDSVPPSTDANVVGEVGDPCYLRLRKPSPTAPTRSACRAPTRRPRSTVDARLAGRSKNRSSA